MGAGHSITAPFLYTMYSESQLQLYLLKVVGASSRKQSADSKGLTANGSPSTSELSWHYTPEWGRKDSNVAAHLSYPVGRSWLSKFHSRSGPISEDWGRSTSGN